MGFFGALSRWRRREEQPLTAVATKGGDVGAAALPPTLALGGEMEQYQTLLEACKSGDEAKILSLVQAGASLEKLRAVFGFFPLHVAAERGDERMAKFFVSEGAHVDVTMRLDRTSEVTALYLACVEGKMGVARVLIDGGCDVNKGDIGLFYKTTPLFRMCAYYFLDHATEAVKLLLQAGADPEITDYLGQTPLMESIDNERLGLVQLLLASGANPNTRGRNNQQLPLVMARETGQYEVVQTLLLHGARV